MSALWDSAALRAATGGRIAADIEAQGVSIDTRSLVAGELFVALRGERDGHAHVARALQQGAAGAVIDDPACLPPGCTADDPRLLRVADTRAALGDLGRFARQRFTGRVIAVTGSVGKTTTKEMLRLALSALGATHASSASHNNHWGVPLTLSRLPPDAAYCVCEIGMNHAGEIAPLATLSRPDIAVITSIAAAHIGHLGSLEAIAREKGALVEALRPGGVAILPAGAPGIAEIVQRARAAGARVIRFGGPDDAAEARLTALSLEAHETRCTIALPGESVTLRLAAPGRHMAMNALACLGTVHALQGDVRRAAEALSAFRPDHGRGARRPLLGGAAWLLDESYNASGASVRAALEVLRLTPARRHVAVLGDMLELGDFAAGEHEMLAAPLRESAELVYCCGDMMSRLYEMLPRGMQGGCAPSAAALAPAVAAGVRAGDVVLVKGSYGSRMRDVVAALSARAA